MLRYHIQKSTKRYAGVGYCGPINTALGYAGPLECGTLEDARTLIERLKVRSSGVGWNVYDSQSWACIVGYDYHKDTVKPTDSAHLLTWAALDTLMKVIDAGPISVAEAGSSTDVEDLLTQHLIARVAYKRVNGYVCATPRGLSHAVRLNLTKTAEATNV